MTQNTTLDKLTGSPAVYTKSDPAYKRIEIDLRDRVARGLLAPGAMLPGRAALAREYGVALATAERAVANLLSDGTLVASGGRGTFVASLGNAARPMIAIERPAALGQLGILCTHAPASTWNVVVINSIERAFSAAGGSCRFLERSDGIQPATDIEAAVRSLIDTGCKAIIVDALHWGVGNLPQIDFGDVPLIYVTSEMMRPPSLNVYHDNYEAGYHAAKHLIDQGCADILFVAPFTRRWGSERYDGVQAACATLRGGAVSVRRTPDLDVAAAIADDYHHHPDLGRRSITEDMGKALPTGIIAANDLVALGVVDALADRGASAGSDYLLIGFDDSKSITRDISTMRPPLEELGTEAATMAINAISGTLTVHQVRLRSHLLARSTTNSHRSGI
ncbi:MAG TPA: GntR family transcriptional regulator [Capsulimonadaceae bacterium]|jgi:DNA-binding LacI/PurR family transcriptional regulator/DNA-binding transcriptional regulator YhcF (GntR family)